VLYAISIYCIYRIYKLLLRLLISLEFCFKACVQVSASCRNAGCKTFMPLFYGTVNQPLINLVPFIRDALRSWHQSVCQRWAVRIFTLWTRASRLMGSTIVTLLMRDLLPDIKQSPPDYFTFQQDGTPAHRARETVSLLRRETPDFIPPDLWPPNSRDLNPADYKIWGSCRMGFMLARLPVLTNSRNASLMNAFLT